MSDWMAPAEVEKRRQWNEGYQAGMDEYLGWVKENPQAHIDALVEAGVLEKHVGPLYKTETYTVVQPHKHEWRVAMDADVQLGHLKDTSVHVGTVLPVICHGCHELRWVPNRLPIEVPDA